MREALERSAPDAEPRALALFAAEGRVALESREVKARETREGASKGRPHGSYKGGGRGGDVPPEQGPDHP
ncbi:hypothetical protein [Streptomyces sp. NPDC058664]|uniref:hypothetical protein n=1 Tax=unclassified Streptomyces TaxID=2593676 RepID=UPI0036505BFD